MSAGAPPVEAPVPFDDLERVGVPRLPVDGHHVGMPGEHDPALRVRSDGGVEVRLGRVLVRHDVRLHAVSGEVVAHEVDEVEVGIARHGGKPDQGLDQFSGRMRHVGGLLGVGSVSRARDLRRTSCGIEAYGLPLKATVSIFMRSRTGNAETATQVRAGRFGAKASSYTAFTRG